MDINNVNTKMKRNLKFVYVLCLCITLRKTALAWENTNGKSHCFLGIDSIQLTTINKKTQVHIPTEVCTKFLPTIILDLEPSRIFHKDLRIIHKHKSQEPDLNFKYNVYSTKFKDEKQKPKIVFGAFIVETDEGFEAQIRMGYFVIEEDDKTYTFYSLLPWYLLQKEKTNELIIMRNKVFLKLIQARPEKNVVPVKLIFHHSIYESSIGISDFLSYSMLVFSALKDTYRLQSFSDVDGPYFVIKTIQVLYEPGQFAYNLPSKMAPLACLLHKKVNYKQKLYKSLQLLNKPFPKYEEELNVLTQEITNLKFAIANNNEATQDSFLDKAIKENCAKGNEITNFGRGLQTEHVVNENQITVLFANTHDGIEGDHVHGLASGRLCRDKNSNIVIDAQDDWEETNASVVWHLGRSAETLIHEDEKNQILTTNCWLTQSWTDTHLQWNASDFDGLDVVRIPYQKVWKPDVILYNNADSLFNQAIINTNVIVKSDGDVVWLSHGMFKSSCDMNVEYFPFDVQSCKMKWASWTYDGFQVV
ncbi:hypothetical protein QYM36_009668 [Artemia franciscana]|uniref:Neurotransmitter-gated ion-channel ligand-binding domain-containing protein n=1 Tax=Artemia franciscana TaxID=6661 RepID=A0AA88HQM1_ARTSF|nr:hypothetical protein QYM36_009668 [Artemia franciscana]